MINAAPETDTDRSIREAEGRSSLDFLDSVPFEDLFVALARHALEQLRLALGPRYGAVAAGKVLETLIEEMPAGEAAEGVRRRIREGDPSLLADFDLGLGVDWQDIAGELQHLFAFAWYGYGRHFDPAASETEIAGLIEHFRRVVADAGIRVAAGENFRWIGDTLAAAEARWAIDHGGSVAPGGLAALARVRPKTIANLLAAREIAADADGRVPAAEALRYLERREDFVRSTWRHPVERPEALRGTDDEGGLAEQVFVPVGSDGNPFLPSIARRGRDGVPRYAIGAKSDPEYVEDYWEALERLARMPTPRWRRPPASGRGGWSLVSAQEGWRRFARVDLERMVEASRA